MLLLAWLAFVAWIILVGIVVSAHGFAGPLFWSIHSLLLLGVIAWGIHFARRRRYSKIEIALLCLFVILAIGGVGSSIGIGCYRGNQISRLRRTMVDMGAIATAWEARAEEIRRYNAAGAAVTVPPVTTPTGSTAYPGGLTLRYTYGPDALAPILAPTYIREFPRVDGWGNAWRFATDAPFGGSEPAEIYLIQSPGANGRFDPIVRGNIVNYDCDIVYSNGTFISW